MMGGRLPGGGAAGLVQVNGKLIQGVMQQEGEELALDVEVTEIEAEKQEAAGTDNKVKGHMLLVGYVNGICVG